MIAILEVWTLLISTLTLMLILGPDGDVSGVLFDIATAPGNAGLSSGIRSPYLM